jgi:hypothetical protein
MPLALPPLNALWRPNTGSTVDDLERIRTYIGWPGTQGSLTELIQQLNTVADLRPAMVTQVQAWVDEVADLEETQADAVAAGTAHLGNAEEYEGPIPGTSPTRDQQLSQAEGLQWDTSLLKARYRFGTGSGMAATAQGQRDSRIELLINRIAAALNVRRMVAPGAMSGSAPLLRS